MNEILTSEALTLQEKGIVAILGAFGRMSITELNIYTCEEEETLYDVLDMCLYHGIVKLENGYYSL